MDLLSDPAIWIAFLMLTTLEIVLGVDNIVFLSILVGRLPEGMRNRARRVGLLFDGYGLERSRRSDVVDLMIAVAVMDTAREAEQAQVRMYVEAAGYTADPDIIRNLFGK